MLEILKVSKEFLEVSKYSQKPYRTVLYGLKVFGTIPKAMLGSIVLKYSKVFWRDVL